MRSLIVFALLFTIELSAVEETSCIQKLEELEKLRAESLSGLTIAAFYLVASTSAFSKSDEEKLRKEKIRVLEMELKSCQ